MDYLLELGSIAHSLPLFARVNKPFLLLHLDSGSGLINLIFDRLCSQYHVRG